MYTPDTRRERVAWPVVDNFMPDFTLPSVDEQMVQTLDYHSPAHDHDRRSLILLFLGECSSDNSADYSHKTTSGLLLDLARHYTQIVGASAEVLAVVRGTLRGAAQIKQDSRLPFPVLADEDGQVHRNYGATTADGRSACEAVYVAGRFGKIYLSSRASDGPPLPTVRVILGSMYFIESRCPECGREEL
jgi:hypothetical protein